MTKLPYLILVVLAVAGCRAQTKLSTKDAAANSPEAIAEEFASALAREDWGGAFALTSKQWQSKWTEEGTRTFYRVLARGYEKKNGVPLKVESIVVKAGTLPVDPLEAKEQFGITTEPPMETWRAWVIAELKTKDGKTAAALPMLAVEEKGSIRIAFVAFNPLK